MSVLPVPGLPVTTMTYPDVESNASLILGGIELSVLISVCPLLAQMEFTCFKI